MEGLSTWIVVESLRNYFQRTKSIILRVNLLEGFLFVAMAVRSISAKHALQHKPTVRTKSMVRKSLLFIKFYERRKFNFNIVTLFITNSDRYNQQKKTGLVKVTQ